MASTTGKGIQLKQFEDVVLPNIDDIDPERGVHFAKTFQYQEGDIVQCSYPKSGCHWFENMIWKLKSLQPTDQPKHDILEGADQAKYDIQTRPRFICSHLNPHRLYLDHIANKGKVVLILRNPKDVLVSRYYNLKNAAVYRNKQTLDEFFDSFMIGEVPYGSYFSYLSSWEKVFKGISEGKGNLQVEVFYYEEFLQSPKENLARLNAILGFERQEEYLERVLKATTFNALRERYLHPDIEHPLNLDGDGNSIIFRKGKVGDWKNHLKVAQSEAVEAMVAKMLQHDLIKFKYELRKIPTGK